MLTLLLRCERYRGFNVKVRRCELLLAERLLPLLLRCERFRGATALGGWLSVGEHSGWDGGASGSKRGNGRILSSWVRRCELLSAERLLPLLLRCEWFRAATALGEWLSIGGHSD